MRQPVGSARPPEVPEPPEGSQDGTTGRLLVLLAEGAERGAATRGWHGRRG